MNPTAPNRSQRRQQAPPKYTGALPSVIPSSGPGYTKQMQSQSGFPGPFNSPLKDDRNFQQKMKQ